VAVVRARPAALWGLSGAAYGIVVRGRVARCGRRHAAHACARTAVADPRLPGLQARKPPGVRCPARCVTRAAAVRSRRFTGE
jgi:hypothetical protein